jgi:hypothetical protein
MKNKYLISRNAALIVIPIISSIIISTLMINNISIPDLETLNAFFNETMIPVDESVQMALDFVTLILITVFTISILKFLRVVKSNCHKKTHKKITKIVEKSI